MAVLVSLVATAFAIIISALGWAWSSGTLHETAQERLDRHFERITERF